VKAELVEKRGIDLSSRGALGAVAPRILGTRLRRELGDAPEA